MKRSLISLALTLALVTGCSTAAAPKVARTVPRPSVPTAVTLSATAQSKLVVVLTDCSNSITVNEAEGVSLSYSGSSNDFQYTVSGPTEGVTTVRITQLKDNFPTRYTLNVPKGAYQTIRMELRDSAVSLFPQAASYELSGKDNAVSATVSSTYTGKLSGSLEDSAVSLSVSAHNPSLSLNLALDDCAVSAPEVWSYKQGKPLVLTRGTGEAEVALQFKDCAVSVEELSTSYLSRYEGQASSMSFGYSYDSLQLLMGDIFLWNGSEKNVMDEAKATSKPNNLVAIKNIPADGIIALQVNVNFCAVVLEPSKSGAFELAYQGVEDVKSIAVSTEVKGGVLSVTSEGAKLDKRYFNASPDWRVNCVRLLVPEGVLQSLAVDCGAGIVATNGLTLPAVTGGTLKGMVSLNTGTVSSPIALSSDSGSLDVIADTVSAPVTLDTKNGSGGIKANSTTADISLNAKNGSVDADVGTATGKLTLTVKNGSIEAEVDTVTDGVFQATNGSIEASLGTITGNTSCIVTNGSMEVELRQKPTDLSFHLSGGWRENRWDYFKEEWYKKEDLPTGLPSGWYDGLVLGSGKPSLTLTAASNGDISFTAPKI